MQIQGIRNRLGASFYIKMAFWAYICLAAGLLTIVLLADDNNYVVVYPSNQVAVSSNAVSTIQKVTDETFSESSSNIFTSAPSWNYDRLENVYNESESENEILDRLRFNLMDCRFYKSDILAALKFYSLDERKVPTLWPVQGKISSGFGFRIDPINFHRADHKGLDFYAPMGTEVTAPADGIVTTAGWRPGYGRVIEIDHGNGFSTRYGHLLLMIVHGDSQVRRGDRIGLVGSSGRSTMSHLHYEVRWEGVPIDPQPFLLVRK